MKKQRVYLDTSVIGGCFDDEFSIWSIGLMDDFATQFYHPVISELVVTEIALAPLFVQKEFAKLFALQPEIVPLSDQSLELAHAYQERNILTSKFYNDSIHIALATVAEVDVLVSWNFKHIVNFNKIRQFNAVNLELGFKQIQIFSPREVTTYDINEN